MQLLHIIFYNITNKVKRIKAMPDPKLSSLPDTIIPIQAKENHKKPEFDAKSPDDNMTASSVFEWGQSFLSNQVESSNKAELGASSAELSHFGLQNSEHVIRFLKTPEGKAVRTEIVNRIIEEQHIKEEQQAQAIEHSHLMHRVKVFLILLLVADETKAADIIKELTAQQNEKSLKEAEKAIKDGAAISSKNDLEKTISNYDTAISDVDNKIQNNHVEKQQLEAAADKLKVQEQDIANKYAKFNEGLDELEKEASSLDSMSKEALQQKIKELDQDINDKQTTIMMDDNITDNARKILQNENNQSIAKLGAYKDLLAVKEGTKYYATADGKQVTSIAEADYILPSTQKIVVEGEKTYLLKQGQTLENMTSEDKENAANAFEKAKPELQSVKGLVNSNKTMEDEAHKERVQMNTILLAENKVDSIKLQQLRNGLEIRKAEMVNRLNNLDSPALNKMPDQKNESHPFDNLQKKSKDNQLKEPESKEEHSDKIQLQ